MYEDVEKRIKLNYNVITMAKLDNPVLLQELYVNQRMHVKDVAIFLGVGKNTVVRALTKYGISKDKRFPDAFTPEQESILYGSLLGDANLSIQKNGTNACLRMEQGIKQTEWLRWKFDIFQPWINSDKPSIYMNRTLNGASFPSIKFTTVATPLFTKHYHICYNDNVKVVNKTILDKIDALALAVWFQDDGSFSYSVNHHHSTMKLATNCFNKFEQEMICAYFHSKWNINPRIVIDRKGTNETYHLEFRIEDARNLVEIIRPFVISSLEYKLDARAKASTH